MLGENHSLVNEFPNFSDLIAKLISEDQKFAQMAHDYDNLDEQLRNLELDNSPISDEAMRKMKHDRAELKDRLYKILITY